MNRPIILIRIIVIALVALMLSSCINSSQKTTTKALNLPQTEQVVLADYEQILYVSENGTDTTGYGNKEQPFRSLAYALQEAGDASSGKRIAILLAQGTYSGETFQLKEFVDLYGGYNSTTWQRDIEKYTTTLSGGEERRVLLGADNMRLDGFSVSNGLVKGKGAALLCEGSSPLISNNQFSNNKTLGPDNWDPEYWHETANDGGAIHGQNGSAAIIRNNIFTRNKTENGRGAAVSFDGKCTPVIRNNIFLANMAGLNDPMRSSDGGAVNIFDWCDAVIEGNLFISNRAQSKNDGGAVFIALWSSAKVTGNLFVDNHSGDDAGALFVGGQEHRYDGPLDPIPPKDNFFVSIKENTFIGNHHGGTNSGAMRFTMESRGEFIANTLAHNNGVYFQRSEVHVADNVILDNFLFIETKKGLEKGIIEDNILWADYDQQVEADVKNNNMRDPVEGNGNYHQPPRFQNDGFALTSLSTNYIRQNNATLIQIAEGGFNTNELTNRVVKTGAKWGVIKSNTADTITLWGNFLGVVDLTVLPTYTLIGS